MNLDEPILTPAELLSYRRSAGALKDFTPPQTVIFAPQRSLAKYVLRRHFVKRIKGFLGEFYLLRKYGGRIALSTGFGIGAPVVAGLADEFAALGVRRMGIIGMAGGLQDSLSVGNIVLSTGSIRGEGVTRHYLPPGETVEASPEILRQIESVLSKRKTPYQKGLTWTTDVPFRELRRDVLMHESQGVLAVDMEAAGLLGVAKSHGLEAFAAFSVADQLSGGVWRMSRDLRLSQASLALLFGAVCEALG
jgi:uridine phosphorylase